MASQLAESICERYFDKKGGLLKDAVDVELQEAREVLEGLQTHSIELGDLTEAHWCNPDRDCGENCERARALFERLRV